VKKKPISEEGTPKPTAHRVRLPGFLVEKEVGLGDVIKRVTSAMGIRPCGGRYCRFPKCLLLFKELGRMPLH